MERERDRKCDNKAIKLPFGTDIGVNWKQIQGELLRENIKRDGGDAALNTRISSLDARGGILLVERDVVGEGTQRRWFYIYRAWLS